MFNEVNARSIDDTMNVFKGLFTNGLFMAIIVFTVAAQYAIVQFGGDFVRTVPLDADQWVKCILLGALSLPLGGLMRLIPVRESRADFAAVSPLIKTCARKNKETIKEPRQSSLTMSFMLWLVVVTALPVVTYHRFEEHWAPVMEHYLSVALAHPAVAQALASPAGVKVVTAVNEMIAAVLAAMGK